MKRPERLQIGGTSINERSLILKYAAEARRFEIERFWQRSAFFWTFIGAAFVAFGALYSSKNSYLLTVVSAFGGLTSFAWTLQNRGSKYWQEAWEQKVEAVENEVLGTPLFSNREPVKSKGFWGAADFSVSRLAISISDLTVILWLTLFYEAARIGGGIQDYHFGWIVFALAFVYAMMMLAHTRSDWKGSVAVEKVSTMTDRRSKLISSTTLVVRGGFQNSRASFGATRNMHAAWSRPSTMKPSRS